MRNKEYPKSPQYLYYVRVNALDILHSYNYRITKFEQCTHQVQEINRRGEATLILFKTTCKYLKDNNINYQNFIKDAIKT